jgi:hypothetical protein
MEFSDYHIRIGSIAFFSLPYNGQPCESSPPIQLQATFRLSPSLLHQEPGEIGDLLMEIRRKLFDYFFQLRHGNDILSSMTLIFFQDQYDDQRFKSAIHNLADERPLL